MNYYNKYIKYKEKYINLKYNMIGGSNKNYNPFIKEENWYPFYQQLYLKYKDKFRNYNKKFYARCISFIGNNMEKKLKKNNIKISEINKNKIVKYNFYNPHLSINFINIFNKINFSLKYINKIYLFVNEPFILESIIYILKKNNEFNLLNKITILFLKYEGNMKFRDNLFNIINKNSIDKINHTNNIKVNGDFFLVNDNNIFDNEKNVINGLNQIFNILPNINKNGKILFIVRNIFYEYIYNIIFYIGNFFKKVKIETLNNKTTWLYIYYDTFIGINKDNILDLKLLLKKKKFFLLKNSNFIKYKFNIIKILKKKFNELKILEYILKNDDKELLQEMFLFNFTNKINYYKSIGIELVDWIDSNGIKKDYYIDKINDLYDDIDTKYIVLDKIKPLTLKITDNITMNKEDHQIGIDVYNYKNDIYMYEDYSSLQKEVAKKQKQLQNTLLSKYNIRFNNKRVSRAWCKLYEIYRELNFFKNIKKDINIFFICEAPGMWVHSTMDYFKRHMNKNFKWTAQSLKLDGMGLKDNYGFMKRTKKFWDYGILGNGDITRYENLEYYKSKYGEFDCVLGDCGLSYNLEKKLTNYNLAIYQMLYSLTLLRKNGNFILKMVGVYKEPLFLSLLEYITSMFNKVYILKASRNFSSSENYIVGINYNKTSDLSKDFIEILKKYKKGEYVYPLSKISSNFVKNYFNVKKELIEYENANIKFYSFLSNNDGMMKLFKSNLDKYIKTQNDKWIKKYLL